MPPTMNRDDALAHVNRGRPLAFLPKDGNPRRVTDRTGFPQPDEPGEYAPVYDPRGNLTRAGMRVVLAEGGSVSHAGRVIDSSRDLPSEEAFEEAETAQPPAGAVASGLPADVNDFVGRFIDDMIAALQARRAAFGPAPRQQQPKQQEEPPPAEPQPTPTPPPEEVPTAQPVEEEEEMGFRKRRK